MLGIVFDKFNFGASSKLVVMVLSFVGPSIEYLVFVTSLIE